MKYRRSVNRKRDDYNTERLVCCRCSPRAAAHTTNLARYTDARVRELRDSDSTCALIFQSELNCSTSCPFANSVVYSNSACDSMIIMQLFLDGSKRRSTVPQSKMIKYSPRDAILWSSKLSVLPQS